MAPDFTFGNALQLCPHAPQFFGSVATLTHAVPQTSGELPLQLGRHFAGCVCVEHSGVVPLHSRLQVPQCCGLLRSASQPSLGSAEQ
jgi:hypothetical protein